MTAAINEFLTSPFILIAAICILLGFVAWIADMTGDRNGRN